ncbi:uncharacterized protein E0L32_010995 [Thyridium curvatum]|uniref:Cytochrome b5 heme-binding domain-containing protein n=1 Tax=Thyridium curvatum TaxID=1093900 RepID=A0A507ASB0_9PEZI|nr:uncharacterized protein E0L32_010995 [Thyridium curvatum]TPX07100.1 hypothetical protein E0L32_010995 [Thyridium curvatum]
MVDDLPVSPTFTQSEIATHTRADDAWIIIHGKVYDVTSFLDEHPGGRDVLIESAGKDATADYDFAGHSDDATGMLRRFEIGALSGWIKAVVMQRGITSARVRQAIIARALPAIVIVGLTVAYARPALARISNWLPQAYFLVLAAVGFDALWGSMLRNGTAQTIGALKQSGVVEDGSKLRKAYMGLPGVDSSVQSAVIFYDTLLRRQDVVDRSLLLRTWSKGKRSVWAIL